MICSLCGQIYSIIYICKYLIYMKCSCCGGVCYLCLELLVGTKTAIYHLIIVDTSHWSASMSAPLFLNSQLIFFFKFEFSFFSNQFPLNIFIIIYVFLITLDTKRGQLFWTFLSRLCRFVVLSRCRWWIMWPRFLAAARFKRSKRCGRCERWDHWELWLAFRAWG